MSIHHPNSYEGNVVILGDNASMNFKEACDDANRETPIAKHGLYDVETGMHPLGTKLSRCGVKETIDGVGTKVSIYTNALNGLVKQFKRSEIEDGELHSCAVEILERMIYDLVAMNADDLREGEVAIGLTNIIDVNSLREIVGVVFENAMAKAMPNVIKEIGIPITAGEIAIMGEKEKLLKAFNIYSEMVAKLLAIDSRESDSIAKGTDSMSTHLSIKLRTYGRDRKRLFSDTNDKLAELKGELELTMGGTCLGLTNSNEVFVPLEAGQKVVYLQEVPTKSGIIGPRANGITKIREYLRGALGEDTWFEWENLSFEEFLEAIGEERASRIPQSLKDKLGALKMWDIATGRTSVFNPFVSRVLLGGLNSNPKIQVSSLIHVTGNPGRKLKDGLKGEKELTIHLDLENVVVPDIIAVLQYAFEVDIDSWNMGVPYAIICLESDANRVIALAREAGITADIIGEVVEGNGEVIMENVGVRKEKLLF